MPLPPSPPKPRSTTTAADNLQAVIQFFTKFPELNKVDFWINGESYAGIYIPMLVSFGSLLGLPSWPQASRFWPFEALQATLPPTLREEGNDDNHTISTASQAADDALCYARPLAAVLRADSAQDAPPRPRLD